MFNHYEAVHLQPRNRGVSTLVVLLFLAARICIADDFDQSSIFYLSAARLAELTGKSESGDADSAKMVANYYIFVDRRERFKAEHFLEIAAIHGDTKAQHNFGVYLETLGEPQKVAKAVGWFVKAAQGGDLVAARKLGRIYEEGRGVPQDLREAVKWYHVAVDGDDIAAMRSLLDIVTNGAPEYRDNLEAYTLARYLCVAYASDKRQPEYINQMSAIRPKLTADEIEQARAKLPGPISFGCE